MDKTREEVLSKVSQRLSVCEKRLTEGLKAAYKGPPYSVAGWTSELCELTLYCLTRDAHRENNEQLIREVKNVISRLEREYYRCIMTSSSDWLEKSRNAGTRHSCWDLAEMCATQFAVVAMASNLSEASAGNNLGSWMVFANRVLKWLVVPYVNANSKYEWFWEEYRAENRLDVFKSRILEIGTDFKFQGIGAAVTWIRGICIRVERELVRRNYDFVKAEELSDDVLGTYGKEDVYPTVDVALSDCQLDRREFWRLVNETLRKKSAVKFYVLVILKLDYNDQWSWIADYLNSHLESFRVSYNRDLHDYFAWSDIELAFEDRPHTTDKLKSFYFYCQGKLTALGPDALQSLIVVVP